jgi:hypothetical protein
MTTRNFRVNNGLSVGDIVIDASANTIVGLATSAPSADGDVSNKKYVDDQIAAISTTSITTDSNATNAAVSGTGASGTLTITANSNTEVTVNDSGMQLGGSGARVNSILDEDNLASDSATALATQQSIKAYVDTELGSLSSTTLTSADTNSTFVVSNTSAVATVASATQLTITNGLVRVHGNLTVDGTETILNTTTLSVEDNIIEVNRNVSNNAGMPSISGMKVNRGEGSTPTEQDLFWAWDETFADDGTTTYGNAGGAWTSFKRAQGDSSTPGTADLADIRANVVHATSTSAQYADVAERFEADAPMTAGAVVEVAGTAEITESTTDLSENVFGVISDMPAYAMNAGAGNNDTHPFVAMTGRTPVRVTGAVTKGQRLVTSSVKGCARAVAVGESITPFNVIGRALESSTDAGIKLVNCAVRTNN